MLHIGSIFLSLGSYQESQNFFVCLLGCTRVCTQGLLIARQVLYKVTRTPSLFCCSYFSEKVSSFSSGLASNCYPPIYTSRVTWITFENTMPNLFLEVEDLTNFAWAGLEPQSL
jgi:hypothetical protein